LKATDPVVASGTGHGFSMRPARNLKAAAEHSCD